jgi:hypothetical protein
MARQVDRGLLLGPHSDDHGERPHVGATGAPPGGSPAGVALSPVLFLFFNADLVQSRGPNL